MISKDEPVEIAQPNKKVHILEKELETACGLEIDEDQNTDEIEIRSLKDFFELRFDLCENCEKSKVFLKVLEWSEEKND